MMFFPQLIPFLFNRSRRATALAVRKPRLAELTAIEWRVLKLVAEYKLNKEIADQLCLSVRAIEHHRNARKLTAAQGQSLVNIEIGFAHQP